MRVLGWRAWYTGGRVYDSREITWVDLPDDGVLYVMVYFDDGTRRGLTGDDVYFDVEGTIASNRHPIEETRRRYPESHLKRGRWVNDAEMRVVNQAAAGAMEF